MNLEMKKTNKRPRDNSTFLKSTYDHQHHQGYECKTCSKRFTTYQALGGHQGIHKKIKFGDENDASWLTLNIVGPKYSELHLCKLCKKGFGTGLALGGDMTLHRLENDLTSLERSGQKLAAQKIEKNNLIITDAQRLRMMKAEEYEQHCNLKDELILGAKEWRLAI